MKLEPRNLKSALLGVVALLTGHVFAGDVRMSVDQELIGLLDRAVLKVEYINAKPESINMPDIEGLDITYLKNQRDRRSFTDLYTGKTTTTIIHRYLITPTKVGDYTIGPVLVKFKGGEKEFSAKLRVIKSKDDTEAQQLSEIMFSRITCSNPSPFVQEPFDLKVQLYIRDGIQLAGGFALKSGLPEQGLDGELEWEVGHRGREERNGSIFNTYTLHTTVKTLTAGTFSFQPGVQVHVVVPRQRRRSYGFDDPYFGDLFGRQETRPIVLDCNRLDVEVKPIPVEGRPASFTGGIGRMDFDVDIGPTRLKVGEPVTVKMRISGTGNLEKITPPAVADDPYIKLYEVRSIPTQNRDEVLFEQVAIPTTDAIKEIPAISFSYFNTQTADFRTITKGPFPLVIDAAPQQSAKVLTSMVSAGSKEIEVLGHDIAYLKSMPSKWGTSGKPLFHQTPLFKVMLVLPALLVVITGLAVARRSHLERDVALARRQKAPRVARHNIQLAEQALKKSDATVFYEAAWNALAEYFGHRLNLAPGQVTLHILRERIPGETDAIEQLFNQIEHRRYGIRAAEEDPREEMKKLLSRLVALLKKCERMKL